MTTYADFANIPNGTRIFNYGYDQCVALANHYHQDVIGGSFIPVNSAYEWWTGSWGNVNALYTKSATPVAGAIFVARGGIYNSVDGHIGVVLGVSGGSIQTIEQNGGTWRYVGHYTRPLGNGILGYLIPKNNPANVPLAANQRKVGNNPANRRKEPNTQSASGEPLDPGSVGNFNGWIRGEQVSDGVASTNVWFRGISGDWFWAGAFTSQATTGLADLNPKAPSVGANQRQVDPTPVNVRATASSGAQKTGELAANAVVTPDGWVNGQVVDGIGYWFKVAGGFAWAGGFTNEGTSGLKDLNQVAPQPPTKPEPTDPTGPTGDDRGPGPVLGNITNWSEPAPEYGSTNFTRPAPASASLSLPASISERTAPVNGGYYPGRPAAPNHVVLHHAAQPNLQGAISTLSGPDAPTANHVVKDTALVTMVDERDTPSTNGRWASNEHSVTFEVCNDKTTTDKPSPESHETAAWGVARAAVNWGMRLPLEHGVNVFGHKEVSKSPTACPGQLDVDWITARANEIITAQHDNTPTPAPDYSDLQKSLDGLSGAVTKLTNLLKSIFKIGGGE